MKSMILAAAAASALLASAPAGAVVLDMADATRDGGTVTLGAYRFSYLGYGNVAGLFQSSAGKTALGDVQDDWSGNPFQLTRTDGASFDLRSLTFGTTPTSSNRVVVGDTEYQGLADGQTIAFPALTNVTSVFFDAMSFGGSVGIQGLDVVSAADAAAAVPEPATWGMMILGFGLVGGAMRTTKRRSDAKFDLKIKRIAAGLEA